MAKYSAEELGFLDETSKDNCTPTCHFGRLRKGKRAEKKQAFVWGCRTLTEALLTLDGIVVGMVVEGSMTKVTFLEYLKFTVVHCF